ncbi:RNA-directed DNA polymerase, eukaryota [Tanacetum coccineum]
MELRTSSFVFFFYGIDPSENKISWVAWNKVLASKNHGGLGISSFFALNRALLLKWIWRFISSDGSLWSKVIQALYGKRIDFHATKFSSIWCSIIRELHQLKDNGFDFWEHCKIRIGNGFSTRFWYDLWIGDMPLYAKFPRLFALDLNKDCSVADKLNNYVKLSFRRAVRGGIEQHQMSDLVSMLESIVLSSSNDRWVCGLSNDGDFKVKDIRIFLDDLFLPHSEPTRWIKAMPIKINIFAWRARKDCLPTRMNLVQRDINIDSVLCPVCVTNDEDAHHLFFRCDLAQHVLRRLCRWWDLDTYGWSSFHDWLSWFSTIRFPSKSKSLLEGVFYVSWWHIWRFRNRTVFDDKAPNRSEIFDDIVLSSFNWSKYRCHFSFSWTDWLKNPHLISL